jgi:hypothetical protein
VIFEIPGVVDCMLNRGKQYKLRETAEGENAFSEAKADHGLVSEVQIVVEQRSSYVKLPSAFCLILLCICLWLLAVFGFCIATGQLMDAGGRKALTNEWNIAEAKWVAPALEPRYEVPADLEARLEAQAEIEALGGLEARLESAGIEAPAGSEAGIEEAMPYPRDKQAHQHPDEHMARPSGNVRIICVGDTHGREELLTVPDADVFIFSGDFSMFGNRAHIVKFNKWLLALPHRHKIVVIGNHVSV